MKFKVKATGEILDFLEHWSMMVIADGRNFNLDQLEQIATSEEPKELPKNSIKEILGGNKIKIEIE